jgi:hypothetical protein
MEKRTEKHDTKVLENPLEFSKKVYEFSDSFYSPLGGYPDHFIFNSCKIDSILAKSLL